MNFVFLKLQKIKPLWNALSPKRRRQLLGLQILSLSAAAGEVANLGALLPFLRLLANPKDELQALGPLSKPLQALPDHLLILSLGCLFLIVVVLSTSLRLLTICSQSQLSARIAADLSEKVFSVVLHRPFAWHLNHNTSEVLGHLTKDVDQLNGTIKSLLTILVNLSVVLFLGTSLVALAPGVMFVIAVLLSGFYFLVFRFTRGSLRSDGARLTNNYQISLQIAQEGLGGIRDVLLDRSQSFFVSSYASSNLTYRLSQALINIKVQSPRYLIEGFAVILIVGLSLSLALSGQSIEQQLPLLGTLALGAYRLLQPLQQCFSAVGGIQANQASLQKLRPFLQQSSKPKVVQRLTQETLFPLRDSGSPLIELRQLSFRYHDESPVVLRNIDLSIYSGEVIAFVGSTGSGKSTISDLILGLLRPTDGQLLVHGKDLQSNQNLVEDWQQRVAHVPQSIYLSDASFASNIAFGVPHQDIDLERVKLAAKKARISEVIECSSDGYSTIVGEQGVSLSGGQRQRIGLARALYKQAELLVLDEATSALDNRTEAEVMAAIEALDNNITVVLIAHRLSTVKNCDRILHLEKGQIAGLGTYDVLIASNPAFQKLASIK